MKKLITFFRSVIDESLAARHGAKLLILAGLLILLPGTGTIPLIDRDEPRFGQATREMMDRGEWVIPYFNGEYRFDKPVMTYWLMRVFYQFGIHELTSRLHSALFTILTALVMYWWGRRLFGALAGFWGGAGLHGQRADSHSWPQQCGGYADGFCGDIEHVGRL
ncbi:glycosyltransferase family 39 protein [Kamptonema cortianum]|nr:glycosyltransferase family 39 protein [Kamptonema cortianum]